MKKRYAYAECYRILDIHPACSWDELRRAYKMQIQKWHPDRFADKSAEKEAANDKIKRITTAHQQLAAYYRQHGKLPVPETKATERKLPQPNKIRPEPSTTSSEQRKRTTIPKKKPSVIPVAVGMIIIGIIFWIYAPEDDFSHETQTNKKPYSAASNPSTVSNDPVSYSQSSDHTDKDEETSDDKFITYGSSIGEVISIQGIPTKDAGNIWYYDDSELYFENGKVVGWKHAPGSRLKTGIVLKKNP